MRADPVGESADAVTGSAAGLVTPHRSRNIQVCPGRLADKLLEEERRGDGSAPLAANVLQVGDLALHLLRAMLQRDGLWLGLLFLWSAPSVCLGCRV